MPVYMGCLWVIHGLFMGCSWVIHGLFMGYTWVVQTVYVGCSCSLPTWFLYTAHLLLEVGFGRVVLPPLLPPLPDVLLRLVRVRSRDFRAAELTCGLVRRDPVLFQYLACRNKHMFRCMPILSGESPPPLSPLSVETFE
jgi:hypothetical protein